MVLGVVDLTRAVRMAADLSRSVGQPPVLAGALAMAAHGYRRETSDVDIVVPVIIGAPSEDEIEEEVKRAGLTARQFYEICKDLPADDVRVTVRAKHGFGGLDLRSDDNIRINVLTLDDVIPALVPEAVIEAVESDRRITVFGEEFFVVSLGHFVALKLVAERKKDLADIVELFKARAEAGHSWRTDFSEIAPVVRRHLGWYAVRQVERLAAEARAESLG